MTEGVDDPGVVIASFGSFARTVNVLVTVNQMSRLERLHEPSEHGEASMSMIGTVVNIQWWGMCYQDVEVSTVTKPLDKKARNEPQNLEAHFTFSVLMVRTPVVADGSLQAGQNQTIMIDHTAIQEIGRAHV